MKKILISLVISLPPVAVAQNVGIGTTTPFARLQINHQGNTTIGLQLVDSGALRLGAIKFSNINHPEGMYLSGNYYSSFNKDHYLYVSSDTAIVATFRGDGSVGIGTTTPTEKLEVRNALRSTLKIRSGGFNDTTQLIFSNTNASNQGTEFSIKSIREEGLYFSSLSDFGPNNTANSLVVLPNGNVGTGILPTGKLHVNGSMKIEGLNLMEFGAGIAGKEASAGKIGYNAFGTNALAIVGAGTTAANRRVYVFGEGGTTFSGPATITGNTNIGGQLQLNGSTGAAGQVLTSNGTADPTWANTAYTNNTRFGILFNKNAGSTSGDANIWNTLYNLNTTDVTIGTSSITINKSGLYHFDITMTSFINYSVAPSFYPRHELWFYFGSASPLKPIYDQMDNSTTANLNWTKNETVTQDIYITAPAILRFNHRLAAGSGGTISNYQADGSVVGYLISE